MSELKQELNLLSKRFERALKAGTVGGGASSGIGSHPQLSDRDSPDQHPATAITNTPAGNIGAATVQEAISELDTEKVGYSLATAANDFIVASGAGVFVKKTLAETLTILGATATPTASSIPISGAGGTLADGWLTANVPLINAANTFTNSNTFQHATVVPLTVSNLAGTQNIFEVKDNTTAVFTIADGAVSTPITHNATGFGIGATPAAKLDVATGQALFRGGSNSIGGGTYAHTLRFGYQGTDNYQHYIRTRHNGGASANNAIDFYTGDGTAAGVFPTNAVHGMTIDNAKIGLGGTITPVQQLHMKNGHIRLDQVAAPAASTVALGAAGVLTGAYYYRISFVTAQGETESGTISNLISPVAQQVSLSAIPTGAAGIVTARRIYRTTAGGSNVQMALVAELGDNTTTVYTDNIADGSLTTKNPWINTTGGIIYNGATRVGIMSIDATAWGHDAMKVSTGQGNAAFGYRTLYSNTTGFNNNAVGSQALYSNTTGTSNNAMGGNALYSNTTGLNNNAMGAQALYFNTTGHSNSAMGMNANSANTTGHSNSAMGMNSLYFNTTGYQNAVIGQGVFAGNTTGHNNSAIGYEAGRYITGGATANETSNTSVYLGASTKALASGDSNEIVIGYNTTGLGSNTVVLGNSSIATTALRGNVGIGTTNPSTGQLVVNNGVVAQPIFDAQDNGTSVFLIGDGGTAMGCTIIPKTTNAYQLGDATHGYQKLVLHDGTDEWEMTVNTSGEVVTTKV